MKIKELRQSGEAFAPITISEAVLVKHNGATKRLSDVLPLKLEIIESSDLLVTTEGPKVIITHTNEITPNQDVKPMRIKYDSHGHIVQAEDVEPLKMFINGQQYADYDGSQEIAVNFGDDFENKNNCINIHWNGII